MGHGLDHLRQLVLLRNSLGTEMLFDGNGIVSAALDCAVVCNNNAGDALDDADAGDDAAGGNLGLGVQLVAGHGGQFQKRRPGVNQRRDAVPRQHLLASNVLLAGLFRTSALDLARELGHSSRDFRHVLLIFLVLLRRGVDIGLEARYGGSLVRGREVRDGTGLDVMLFGMMGAEAGQPQGLL